MACAMMLDVALRTAACRVPDTIGGNDMSQAGVVVSPRWVLGLRLLCTGVVLSFFTWLGSRPVDDVKAKSCVRFRVSLCGRGIRNQQSACDWSLSALLP